MGWDECFALWQATTDGARNIVPKAWGGRFPFQVRVALATPEILEIPKASAPEALINAQTGKFENILAGPRADQLLEFIRQFHTLLNAWHSRRKRAAAPWLVRPFGAQCCVTWGLRWGKMKNS